jgi:hypothetical protein
VATVDSPPVGALGGGFTVGVQHRTAGLSAFAAAAVRRLHFRRVAFMALMTLMTLMTLMHDPHA